MNSGQLGLIAELFQYLPLTQIVVILQLLAYCHSRCGFSKATWQEEDGGIVWQQSLCFMERLTRRRKFFGPDLDDRFAYLGEAESMKALHQLSDQEASIPQLQSLILILHSVHFRITRVAGSCGSQKMNLT